jgi:hypothetical protein
MDALEKISASTRPVTVTFEQHLELSEQGGEVILRQHFPAVEKPAVASNSTTCLDKDFQGCQFFIPGRKLLHGLRLQSL